MIRACNIIETIKTAPVHSAFMWNLGRWGFAELLGTLNSHAGMGGMKSLCVASLCEKRGSSANVDIDRGKEGGALSVKHVHKKCDM